MLRKTYKILHRTESRLFRWRDHEQSIEVGTGGRYFENRQQFHEVVQVVTYGGLSSVLEIDPVSYVSYGEGFRTDIVTPIGYRERPTDIGDLIVDVETGSAFIIAPIGFFKVRIEGDPGIANAVSTAIQYAEWLGVNVGEAKRLFEARKFSHALAVVINALKVPEDDQEADVLGRLRVLLDRYTKAPMIETDKISMIREAWRLQDEAVDLLKAGAWRSAYEKAGEVIQAVGLTYLGALKPADRIDPETAKTMVGFSAQIIEENQ
tara:strand:+ start:43 stop:834 length:792 start_codon:yes stop_codon:yes gene_type:complete